MDYERVVLPYPPSEITVNAFRIGDKLVDTGHMHPECRERLRDELDGGALDGVADVVVTHPHTDHVGGSMTVPSLTERPHTVYEGVEEILANYTDRLQETRERIANLTRGVDDLDAFLERAVPLDYDYAEDEIAVERVVTDGETITTGAGPLEVISTPGHCIPHLSLYHAPSGTLFSVDLLYDHAHFVWGSIGTSIGAYVESLERVRTLEPDVLVPGHGDPIRDADTHLARCLRTARGTTEHVRSAVEAASGPVAASDVAREVFGVSGSSVRFVTLSVCAYLEYLAERGAVDLSLTDRGLVATA